MTAVTAITAQNTTRVKSVVSINPTQISNQIEFTAKDIKPDAIKIGMLHSASVINAVIKSLNKIKIKKIKGMEFNPISNKWLLSDNTNINYFIVGKK